MGRIHWDVAIYETGGFESGAKLPETMRASPGIERVESLAYLRAKLPEGDIAPLVDGQALGTPWLSLLSATDPTLLPPQLRSLAGVPAQDAPGSADGSAVLTLVGPERVMGKAFLSLQGAREFSLQVKVFDDSRANGALSALGRGATHATEPRAILAFATPIRGVIRLERDDLNRWLMDQTGSISFVPHIGVTLLMRFGPLRAPGRSALPRR